MASSGAMVQIGVRGPQDCFFLAPNQTTYWIGSYPRHTNFAMAELQMPYDSVGGLGKRHITAKIRRAGDLLSRIYKYDELAPITYSTTATDPYDLTTSPVSAAWYVDAFGHSVLTSIEYQIGSHPFDRQSGEYMELHSLALDPPGRNVGAMVGRYDNYGDLIFAGQNTQRFYTPLRAWFCNFYEQALPMVSLYWHDFCVVFDQRPMSQLYHVSGNAVGNAILPTDLNDSYLLCNFVYLDKAERASFASSKHEYLFDQVQHLGEDTHVATTSNYNHSIRFNHPVQQLLWVIQRDAVIDGTASPAAANGGNHWFDFSGVPYNESGFGPLHDTDGFTRAQIFLNNHERTIDHHASYYRLVQFYERLPNFLPKNRWIYTYCFGLKPDYLLDTGSCNFSRMDTAYLRLVYPTLAALQWTGRFRCWARNKNLAKNCQSSYFSYIFGLSSANLFL